MLTSEEFKTKLNEVLENASDPGKVSLILNELHTNYGEVMTEQSTLANAAAELKEFNASLVKSNGELFRQVGLIKEEPEKKEDDPRNQNDSRAKEEDKNDLKNIDEVMEKLLPTWGVK